MDNRKMSLANLHDGEAISLFDAELQRVLDNIEDPNTSPEFTREINVKVKFKPNQERNLVDMSIQPTTKLAPTLGIETTAYIEKDEASKNIGREVYQP